MTDELYALAVDAYRGGMGLRDCIESLGLPIRWQSLRGYMKRRGIPLRTSAAGNRGTPRRRRRQMNGHGYMVIRINGKRVLEHPVIMSSILGRELDSSEVVHHINGVKTDNRPENLELTNFGDHSKDHAFERWSNPEWRAETIRRWHATGNAGWFKPGTNRR